MQNSDVSIEPKNRSNLPPFISSNHESWIIKILNVEVNRYKQLGWWLLLHGAFFCLIFHYIPDYLRKGGWRNFTNNYSEEYITVVLPTLVLLIIKKALNGAMYLIYHAKLPFFEQYMINPEEPWPWESDKDRWALIIKETF